MHSILRIVRLEVVQRLNGVREDDIASGAWLLRASAFRERTLHIIDDCAPISK